MTQINGLGQIGGADNAQADLTDQITLDVSMSWNELGLSQAEFLGLVDGATITENMDLVALTDKIIEEPKDKATLEKLLKKGDALKEDIKKLASSKESLKAKQVNLKAQLAAAAVNDKSAIQSKLDKVEAELDLAEKLNTQFGSELSQATNFAKAALKSDYVKKDQSLQDAVNDFLGNEPAASTPEEASQITPFKAITNSSDPNKTGGGKALGTGGAAGDSPYQFNPLAMANASMVDDWTNSQWDMIGEQQKRQQMMMLFMYYAKMAMSGDIGAMYQFVRFIGYIISRDKAMQNVWMGTKLIELQETSRKATQRLLNTDVGEDTDSQIQWQKELQKIRSEEGIVASSQKLIAQMMEEFTQIVELLTQVQKSLLDSQGNVLKSIGTWR
jgi:hypothetical protein